MGNDDQPAPTGGERPIPPRDIDPGGSADGVDDHRITPHAHGIGHQPTGDLDRGVDADRIGSEAQGARVENAPDADREPDGPGSESRAGV
jgi:hypothetical protein